MAASNDDGSILATTCKASSTDQAVIRLYDTLDWHEIKPPLIAHSLTVTRLAFSPHPQRFLLSVGRDRQWTVFQQDEGNTGTWNVFQSLQKAHSRMILDGAWSPVSGNPFFATAGRDKLVKLWHLAKGASEHLFETISRRSAITAISFTCDQDKNLACLVVGEEDGLISFHVFDLRNGVSLQKSWDLDVFSCAAKAITRAQWRPRSEDDPVREPMKLAIAAADGSVRILKVSWVDAYYESISGSVQMAQKKTRVRSILHKSTILVGQAKIASTQSRK